MSENQKHIIDHVSISIDPNATISEDSIANLVDTFSRIYPISKEEKEEVVKSLHSRFEIRMDRGAVVKEQDHHPWYFSAKKTINNEFWERYVSYLIKEKGFPPGVINSLDAATDEMMDLLGNPTTENDFQRRGLVIGDVQSGKTATYTALINKAADAGYGVIILLTGTIEKLREQTQKRLDEGFIGLDSTAFTQGRNQVFVGVGNYNPKISGWAVTSTVSDFRKSTAQQLIGQLSGISAPVLFVLKKNKSVLESLEQWLRLYNTSGERKISKPMLLIDDEADNASVNTKTDEDPTIINSGIRKLLKLFLQANYVGFTATPFANIFIDPDSNQEMLEDDLFPKDFIYALEAPSNYVGARSIFSEDGQHSYMLKSNDDCEEYIPEKHKKDFLFQELSPSLKEAIASFFIANVIRDLRGQEKTHRTMLVNISRFIAVQEQIAKVIDGFVREIQREIKNYYLIEEEALEYESFSFIYSVFQKNYSDCGFSWSDIQKHLHRAIASIVVKTVNGRNAAKNLNYEEYKNEGLRLIAVGGFSLSRGLTLEGLCISYFYRNSKMYDTLMQMGRWFGYRDGFGDICQIWMNQEAIRWYRYISEATDELKYEVRRMQDQNKTPKDFGLCVRSDINMLLVTARNKMKSAADHIRIVSLNGKVLETPYLHLDKSIIESNLNQTYALLNSLNKHGYKLNKNDNLALNNYQIKNVPGKYISEYLSSVQSHYLNFEFNTDDLAKLISNDRDGVLENWDIVIASGKGSNLKIGDVEITRVQRNFGINIKFKALQMSGKNSRLGDVRFAKGGLTKYQVDEIELPYKNIQKKTGIKRNIRQEVYFSSGIKRNPLLVIYPIELTPDQNSQDIKLKREIKNQFTTLIGLSIGIPKIEGKEEKTLKYKINKIKARELMDISEGDEFEEETGEMIQAGGVVTNE